MRALALSKHRQVAYDPRVGAAARRGYLHVDDDVPPEQLWAALEQLKLLVAQWWNIQGPLAPVDGALQRICVPWEQLQDLPGLEVAAALYREVRMWQNVAPCMPHA